MRFFGLLSRLWACNPSQSFCNPSNPGPIHHNQDCEGFCNHSQSKWFSHNQRGLQADCVHCCNTNYQCRARHCCNRRGNVCVQTWYQPLRSMYKIAKNGCFHISQSGRNRIFILFNPCRLYQDCKISVDTPVLDDYMVLWLCGVPPLSGPCINTEVLNNCIHLPLLTGGQRLIGSSAMIQSAIIKWHPYMFSANMVFG